MAQMTVCIYWTQKANLVPNLMVAWAPTPMAHMQLPRLYLETCPNFLSVAGTKHGAEELVGGKGL